MDLYIGKDEYKVATDLNSKAASYKDYLYKKILLDLVDGLVTDNYIQINDLDSFWEDLSEYRFELYEKVVDNGTNNEELAKSLKRVSEYIEAIGEDGCEAFFTDKKMVGDLNERIEKILDEQILPVMMSRVPTKNIQLFVDDSLGIIKTQILNLLREYGYVVEIIKANEDEDLRRIQVAYEGKLLIDINDGMGSCWGTCNISSDMLPYVLFKVITNDVEYVKVFFPFFCYGDTLEVMAEQENGNTKLIIKHLKTGISVTKKVGSKKIQCFH